MSRLRYPFTEAKLDPGRPIVGIAPGAAYGRAKRWPPRHVATLAGRAIDELGAAVVLIGAAGDRDTGHAIESASGDRLAAHGGGGRFANLIGRTDLSRLVGVSARGFPRDLICVSLESAHKPRPRVFLESDEAQPGRAVI